LRPATSLPSRFVKVLLTSKWSLFGFESLDNKDSTFFSMKNPSDKHTGNRFSPQINDVDAMTQIPFKIKAT